MLGYLAIMQGKAGMRAPAVENIYLIINLNHAYKPTKYLAHYYFSGNEIALPDKDSPFYRKYSSEQHHAIYLYAY
jgi:hypothetical protein